MDEQPLGRFGRQAARTALPSRRTFRSRSSFMPGRLFSTACAMCHSSPMALHITIAPNGSVSQISRETSTIGTQLRIDSAATSSAMRLPSANCSTLERVCSVSWLKECTRRCAAANSFCEMICAAGLIGDLREHAVDGVALGRPGRVQHALARFFGGVAEQPLEQSGRDVGAPGHRLGQLVVAAGAHRQHRHAGLRQARAGIDRDLGDDLAVAAIDQHVGDHRAELHTLGDLAQVRLALALGDLDQILVGQPRRLRQHRPGDGDVVVGRRGGE